MENGAQKPRMLMLEARDICGSATGRNGIFYTFRLSGWALSELTKSQLRGATEAACILALSSMVC